MVLKNLYVTTILPKYLGIRYILNGWPLTNVGEYFLCNDSAKYTRASLPARKM